ncbi:L-serine ammonia-lyase [Sphingomonas sp. Leaf21]|uniref:L-serine ammonia-lyase n=1 Tax=Sphingomonas sp. Leaf21 TaxID=2876550 RepID=UPI001E54CDFF|nr:L-serine ammonia-lyase [Sphingomonas sp. Leaf21]
MPVTALPRDDDSIAAVSVTELFTIGIGPSSSHTVGPMRAAKAFAVEMLDTGLIPERVQAEMFGSLSLTGRGHHSDRAVLLGLAGQTPETVDPDAIEGLLADIAGSGEILLDGRHRLRFDYTEDLLFRPGFLPAHPNGMVFTAFLPDGSSVIRRFYSIGGGAIRMEGAEPMRTNRRLAHPFASGAELLERTAETGLSIAQIVRANEAAWREDGETDAFLDRVRDAMCGAIERGCAASGILPGGLKVQRRAQAIKQKLLDRGPRTDPSLVFEWVSLWALAVNEENAAGGRVVTAPTNGAAGVIPAVMRYYEAFVHGATRDGVRTLLLTAAAVGMLYKKRASISAAEMGCQGEVGVACSMAAAGLAAALGGSPAQVENAAEIGMEHNLGLTCDPIGGLVQIPCIERNTMGAIKAINAAYLALHGDGRHIVSLDQVIETMRQTGEDMKSQYKETSLGGLAVNVVEC